MGQTEDMPNMRIEKFGPEKCQPQHVTVPGRTDIGEVVEPGKNFGFPKSVPIVSVHFPLDGLCAYYHADRVTYVDGPDAS